MMTGYKNFFDQKEVQIKISSFLNVSNCSSKSEEFSLNDIQVLVDSEEKNWFKRAQVGKFWGLAKILISVEGLDIQEMPKRDDITAMVSNHYPCPGPKDQQNKTDKFLSVYGVMYAIVNSRKGKGKALKEHVLKNIVPRGFKEIQGKHQQAIEDKDAAIAFLNDDLQNREYENVALQAQRDVYKNQLQKCHNIITHLRTRYVDHTKDPGIDHTKDPGKDNFVMIIEKNTAPKEDEFYEYPCYIAKIKRRFISTKNDRLGDNIRIID